MAMPDGLFPTPLWRWSHPSPADLDRFAEHILRLQQRDPVGLSRTNQGGWHSSTALLNDPELHDLFSWLSRCCLEAMQSFGWDFNQAVPIFNNAWAMVNRRGHGNRAHLHANSLFSGVAYLRVPPDSGAICFLDPRGGAQMLMPPLMAEASEAARGRHRVTPENGLVLLFPGWLWHEVEPSASDEARICVSFNLGMTPRSAAAARPRSASS